MKMTDETRIKVLTIMNLAMMINNSETCKEVSGEKPTIFVKFYGHVCQIEVCIYENGYADNGEHADYRTYLDNKLKNYNADLDEVITKLMDLCRKWGVF